LKQFGKIEETSAQGNANKEYVARKAIAQHCKKGATLVVTRTVDKKKKRAVTV
jgi:hypothetical protein